MAKVFRDFEPHKLRGWPLVGSWVGVGMVNLLIWGAVIYTIASIASVL